MATAWQPKKRPRAAQARPGARLAAALLAGLLSAQAPGHARADSDGERAALARLAQEVDALQPLAAEAERQADAEDRVRFAYDWFEADLEKIKAGIREHLERPREPRPVPPLTGGYRR